MRNCCLQQGCYIFISLGLCLILSACGGGGTSSSSSLSSSSGASGDLPRPDSVFISEISSDHADGLGMWVELYNSGPLDVSLNGFSVRATGFSTVQYDFPRDIQLKAGRYLVLAEKNHRSQVNTDQIVYLDDFSNISLSGGDAALELIKDGVTQDFIRFGNSKTIPLSAGTSWGHHVLIQPSYGQSLVREAGSWVLIPFSTPGGPNDVAVTAIDNDRDGIPDSAEVAGGTYAGIDYYAMGARVAQPDIFIQIDHMKSTDQGILPAKESMQKVVDAFKARNIAVHFDSGTLYSHAFNPALFNLGGSRISKNNKVDYHQCLGMGDQLNCASIYDYKDKSMDIRRKQVFHYLLMANSQEEDGKSSSSGYAEIVGNDLAVTLGDWGLNTSSENELNKLVNFQAATIMHELGHNLGLDHGGRDALNNKPNYYSTMNYLYQLMGLGSNPRTLSVVERYLFDKKANGFDWNDVCKLEAGPCSRDFRIDYSDGSGHPLNEYSLNESDMIGRGSLGAYADWNLDGQLNDLSYALDLNDDGNKTYLYDYNDWDNLILAFARAPSGNSGASMKRSASVMAINPILNDKQRWSVEIAPSAGFMAAVRRVH